VLNLKDIVFPMTLNQIKKFENLNDISINVYCIEKQKELSILPIRLTDRKLDKHVNLLYVQDESDVGHFVWIKNLSRLVSSQINRYGYKKFFCDRYVYLLKLKNILMFFIFMILINNKFFADVYITLTQMKNWRSTLQTAVRWTTALSSCRAKTTSG